MQKHKKNYAIKSKFVFLIDDIKQKFGKVSHKEAMERANEEGLDLVNVSYNKEFDLPVCKIMDYGKYIYKKSKIEQKNNHHSKNKKEIIISINIAKNDLENKNRRVKDFLEKKYQVLYSLKIPRGRISYDYDYIKQFYIEKIEEFSECSNKGEINFSERKISCLLSPI